MTNDKFAFGVRPVSRRFHTGFNPGLPISGSHETGISQNSQLETSHLTVIGL
jgi:hypothetical protein